MNDEDREYSSNRSHNYPKQVRPMTSKEWEDLMKKIEEVTISEEMKESVERHREAIREDE
jgi:hypothetical protein